MDWTRDDYDNTVENAYYVAGGLAKAFHDYDSLAGWDFRPDGEGGFDFLTDDRVYGPLRHFVASRCKRRRSRASSCSRRYADC